MKKIILLSMLSFGILGIAKAQTPGSVTATPSFTMPSCKPCTTLKSITVQPTFAPGTLINPTSSYSISQIPYTPYSWTGGTPIPLTGDDQWGQVNSFPFEVCAVGNQSNSFVIGCNGALSFDITLAGATMPWALGTVGPLPNAGFPSAMNSIMVYHDMNPSLGGSYNLATYGTAPNRIFVVSWYNVPLFSCTTLQASQQIVFYEFDQAIETYIANKPLCAGWNGGLAIHGIQNATGSAAWMVPGRNNTQWTATNDAWRFTPNGTASSTIAMPPIVKTVKWYDILNPGTTLSSNDSLTNICPTPGTSRTYVVHVNLKNCLINNDYYDTVTVTKNPPIVVTTSNAVDATCYGYADGQFDMNITGGDAPVVITSNGNVINNGQQTGLTAQTYNILVTDASGCTGATSVIINQPTELNLSVTSQSDVLCKYMNTGTVHLNAYGSVPPYVYFNNTTMPIQSSPNFDTLYADTSTFYVTDAHNCIDSVYNVVVLEPDSLLKVSLNSHLSTCLIQNDGSIDALASGGAFNYQYEWNTLPVQTGSTATNLEPGAYSVVVTDANGCITTSQVSVNQELCCQLFMPGAFTPNNDTKNDYYKIIERGGGVILNEFRIYNRWGQEVFNTRDITKGWNGQFKGVSQMSDTYTYIMQYTCNDKGVISQKTAKGDFLLIR
jgi:gliding motility-associated-like protein